MFLKHHGRAAARRRTELLLLLAAAAMLTAGAACSSSVGEAEVAGEPAALTEEAFRQELVNARPPSPLTTALGLTRLGSVGMLRVVQLVQEEVARCMREKGWEYTPQVFLSDVGVAWLPAMSRDEFARTHGFGARLDPIATSGGLLSTGEEEANYVNTLTQEDVDAYYEALDGPIADATAGPAGCQGEARKLALDGHFDAVDALFWQAQDEVASHPEYQAANEAYTTCTSEQGLPWLTNASNAMIIGYGQSRERALTAAQEIDAALIDLECRYPWEIIARRIRHQAQTPLVEANRETLAQARAALSG